MFYTTETYNVKKCKAFAGEICPIPARVHLEGGDRAYVVAHCKDAQEFSMCRTVEDCMENTVHIDSDIKGLCLERSC